MTPEEADREGFAAFMLRLRGKALVSKQVLAAFEATPRRSFVSNQCSEYAWSDRMLPVACGEALEGVDTQAQVLTALDISPGARVLEIGSGTGYTAAVISRLAARVLSLERYRTLVEDARKRLEPLGIDNVLFRHADGKHGVVAEGPFDRIIAWAAYPTLPQSFIEQLSSGGVMIAPIGPADGRQTLVRLTKTGSRFEEQEVGTVRFQPIVSGMAQAL